MFVPKWFKPFFQFSKFSNQIYTSFKEVPLKLSELQTSYSRSQGPGGQNVNKVNSKAQIRFNLNTCDWIPSQVIQKIKIGEANSINQQGQLIITSQVHRQQTKNLQECHRKLKKMIFTHSLVKKERIITQYKQSDQLKERRISEKKRKSQNKQLRKKPRSKDI